MRPRLASSDCFPSPLLLAQVQPDDAGLLLGVSHSFLLPHKTPWQCGVHSRQLCQHGSQNILQVNSPTSGRAVDELGQWLCVSSLCFSCWCIHSFFAPTPHRPLYNAIPHRSTFLIFAAAFVITAVSEVSSR